jgi:hypothetical protein
MVTPFSSQLIGKEFDLIDAHLSNPPQLVLSAPSNGWRILEANLSGHKHAGALDSVRLATTAAGLQGKVQVREAISDSMVGRRNG